MQRYIARFALISLHCTAHCDTITKLFLKIAIFKANEQRAKADSRVENAEKAASRGNITLSLPIHIRKVKRPLNSLIMF
jgi:hypothetical protein